MKSNGSKKMTLDRLARMVANGFSDVNSEFKQVKGRLDRVEENQETMQGQLDRMDNRLDKVADDVRVIKHAVIAKKIVKKEMFLN